VFNVYVLVRIAGKPGWWFFLLLIPGVQIVVWILLLDDLAANFNRKSGFALGLVLLPFVYYPILGFGPARYIADPPVITY